jgi:arabinofuranosyltransferase
VLAAAPKIDRSPVAVWPVLVLLSVFAVVLLRTAWVCDDAYITFRTIDNWVHGYGLRWNVAERVQTFTHPLWLFVVSSGYVITREPYFTSLAWSAALTFGSLWLLARGLAATTTTAIVVLVLSVCSKAFIDFSTSGLENPLTHFLLVLFFLNAWRGPATPRTVLVSTGLLSLVMLTRIDLGLLVLPTAGVLLLRSWSMKSVGAAAAGLLPLLAWELFSITYYGFPFPNTAYAKLNTGIPEALLLTQGLRYLADSLWQDPLSLTTVVAAIAATGFRAGRAAWPAAAGIILYLAYTVWIGGDFMSGRFITAPFLCGLCLIARHSWSWPRTGWIAAGAAIAGLALLTPAPSLISGADFRPPPGPAADDHGISDVRRYYYPNAGLLRTGGAFTPARDRLYDQGLDARAKGTRMMFVKPMGLLGFAAGPSVHLVDVWALADPLLARLPSRQDRWTIGHFARRTPEGYQETLETGHNVIVESGVAAFYDRLALITRGPIWAGARWRAIVKMNRGAYQSLLQSSSYAPGPK